MTGIFVLPAWVAGCPAVGTRAGDCFSQFSTRVRVLLGRALPGAELRAAPGLVGTGRGVRGWHPLGRTVRLTARAGRLLANGQRVKASALRLKPSLPVETVRFEGREYRGELTAWADSRGVWIVNEVALDDYLAGTLGAEVSAS